MDKCLKSWFVFVVSLLLFPGITFAGAWVRPVGEWQNITTFQNYTSCKYWDASGKLHDGPCYHQQQLNPYIEYGLTPNFTVGLNPFFRGIEYLSETQSFNLDNSEIFGRYLLWESDWSAFSTQLSFNVPFRRSSVANDIAGVAPFALSQRQNYLDARLLYGTGGWANCRTKSTWYADFQVSYRGYFDGAADEIHLDLTQGWKSPHNRFEIILKELNTFSMHNQNGPNQPNYDLISIELSSVYWFKLNRAALQLGIQQDVYGKNVGRGTAPFVAVWLKL